VRGLLDWFEDPAHKWRSWIGHTLLVVAIAIPFTVPIGVFYYCAREAEQALTKWRLGLKQDPRDNLLDVVVMMLAVPLFMLVFGLR
jgi:hypothetical protein